MPDVFDQIHEGSQGASAGPDVFDQVHSESQHGAAPQPQPGLLSRAGTFLADTLSKTAHKFNIMDTLDKVQDVGDRISSGDWGALRDIPKILPQFHLGDPEGPAPEQLHHLQDTYQKIKAGDYSGATANVLPYLIVNGIPSASAVAGPAADLAAGAKSSLATLANAADATATAAKGAGKGVVEASKSIPVHGAAVAASFIPGVGHSIAGGIEGVNAAMGAVKGAKTALAERALTRAAEAKQAAPPITDATNLGWSNAAEAKAQPTVGGNARIVEPTSQAIRGKWSGTGPKEAPPPPIAPADRPVWSNAAEATSQPPAKVGIPSGEPTDPIRASLGWSSANLRAPIDPEVLDAVSRRYADKPFAQVKDAATRDKIIAFASRFKPVEAQPQPIAPAPVAPAASPVAAQPPIVTPQPQPEPAPIAPQPAPAPVQQPPAMPPAPAAVQQPSAAAPQLIKPLHEMGIEELDKTIKAAETQDNSELVDLFGKDGAVKYGKLEQIANGSSPRADQAAKDIAAMEESLSPKQRDKLFGVNQPEAVDIELAKSIRKAVGGVFGGTPEELGSSLKWAMSRFDPKNPTKDPIAYAELRRGAEIAEEHGFDTAEVTKAAMRGAASRFKDPNDAAFMLSRLARQGTKTPPQTAETVSVPVQQPPATPPAPAPPIAPPPSASATPASAANLNEYYKPTGRATNDRSVPTPGDLIKQGYLDGHTLQGGPQSSSTLGHVAAENEKAFNIADYLFKQGVRTPEDFQDHPVDMSFMERARRHGIAAGNAVPDNPYRSVINDNSLRLSMAHLAKMITEERLNASKSPAANAIPHDDMMEILHRSIADAQAKKTAQ